MRYVDIDKHVYVRYIDERSKEVVTSLHTIAEILEYTVGLFPIEDNVVEVVRCKDCKHRPSGDGANHNIEFPDDLCPCQCEDFWYSWMPTDNWFCGNGERRE